MSDETQKRSPSANQRDLSGFEAEAQGLLTMRQGGVDRWGRLCGQIFDGTSGDWLQLQLVSQGAAVVRPLSAIGLEDPSQIRALLMAEAAARTAGRGLWGMGLRRINAVDGDPQALEAAVHQGQMQIVEGTIYKVSDVRGTRYLNFSNDWRTDFTIRLDEKQEKAWDKAGYPPLDSLEGRRVRVRGWVRSANGPLIDLYSPVMLEFVN